MWDFLGAIFLAGIAVSILIFYNLLSKLSRSQPYISYIEKFNPRIDGNIALFSYSGYDVLVELKRGTISVIHGIDIERSTFKTLFFCHGPQCALLKSHNLKMSVTPLYVTVQVPKPGRFLECLETAVAVAKKLTPTQ